MVANQEVLAAAGGAQPRDSGVDPLGTDHSRSLHPKGPARNQLHLPASSRRVARIAAYRSHRTTAHHPRRRLSGDTNTRQADEFRREHVSFQESGLLILPHAVRWLWPTDPFGQSDDDRVSRIDGVSGRQEEPAAVHVCPLVSSSRAQPNTKPVLWRKLLGFTGDRILGSES